MKKIIIGIISIILLSSCYSNPEDIKKIAELEKQIEQNKNNEKYKKLENEKFCLEKSIKFFKEYNVPEDSHLGDIWYSNILKTCLVEQIGSEYDDFFKQTIRKNYIIDIVTKNYVGYLIYSNELGFEAPSTLPKKCDINFTKKTTDGIKNIYGSNIKDNELAQEIYNTSFKYYNCINYLKGGSKKIQINIKGYNLNYNKEASDHIIYN